MKLSITFSIFLLFSLIFFSCDEDPILPAQEEPKDEIIEEVMQEEVKEEENLEEITIKMDCSFEQIDERMEGRIDETERAIMEDCRTNSLTSKSDVENNLIGEWELIGHGEGWVPKISQPCGYVVITKDQLTLAFTNSYVDTVTRHLWEVEEVIDGYRDQLFKLKVTPSDGQSISMDYFCEEYMFADATPLDGNMYLFKKVK